MYNELVTEVSKIQTQMQNQVNDELEQRELNRLAYANWCTIETQKV